MVYVVLEPQYQSSLSAAVEAINKNNHKLAIEISGYLIEKLRNPEKHEKFKHIVNTIMDKCRLVNLNQDIELPDTDAKDMTSEQRDNIVGSTY